MISVSVPRTELECRLLSSDPACFQVRLRVSSLASRSLSPGLGLLLAICGRINFKFLTRQPHGAGVSCRFSDRDERISSDREDSDSVNWLCCHSDSQLSSESYVQLSSESSLSCLFNIPVGDQVSQLSLHFKFSLESLPAQIAIVQ
jgi:hypothetical protein